MYFADSHQRGGRVYEKLADDLSISLQQVTAAVELFDEGNTVPFVARYRKEQTGCLSDCQLRNLFTRMTILDEVEAKKNELSNILTQQHALTDSLQMEIDSADTVELLEEIYSPFRAQIKSKATIAKERGLEPYVVRILSSGFRLQDANLSLEALQGCRNIIAEQIVRDIDIKNAAFQSIQNTGFLCTKVTPFAQSILDANVQDGSQQRRKVANGLTLSKTANDPITYKKYFNAEFEVSRTKPFEILAMNRGEKLGFLTVEFRWAVNPLMSLCLTKLEASNGKLSLDSRSQVVPAIEDGVTSMLKPSIEGRMRTQLTDKAMTDAVQTFSRNLWSLLLAPPLLGVSVMGIDPGFRTGCKVCVCSAQGLVLETMTIHPFNQWKQMSAAQMLISSLQRHGVQAIALGDGVASRETESFLYSTLRDAGLSIGWSLVSEDGASVYSASELASHELPNLDVSLRGAVSIARRLQDPLAELVKIDPQHLGIGLYQHDIDKDLLNAQLKGVVESAVNEVGVDVNTASPSLLSYVAGLSMTIAEKIVLHRDSIGAFRSRSDLLTIDGINEKIFCQCAGFLRVRGMDDVLDNTGVHPESYYIVHRLMEEFLPQWMLNDTTISEHHLCQLRKVLKDFEEEAGDHAIEVLANRLAVGVPTLEDIVENITSPGRDIRGQATSTDLKWTEVGSIEDLAVGDQFLGTVKNVVEFGAFVDINVGVTGLVHVCQMKNEKQQHQRIDPHQVVKVGDRVHVEVIGVELERNRISLKITDHQLDF
eukprot:g6422.t1